LFLKEEIKFLDELLSVIWPKKPVIFDDWFKALYTSGYTACAAKIQEMTAAKYEILKRFAAVTTKRL